MISAVYKNRISYYDMMRDFLNDKKNAWKFREKYWNQRSDDLDENKASRYSDYYQNRVLVGNEKIFEEKYSRLLYEKGSIVLKEYEQGLKELDIKGEIFFDDIFNFIDCYVKDYYPSDDEGFDPKFNVDEETLTKRIRLAFDILERNKERWM